MSITELRQRIAARIAEARALLDGANPETGMTDEQEATYTEKIGQVETDQRQLERLERQHALEEDLARRSNPGANPPAPTPGPSEWRNLGHFVQAVALNPRHERLQPHWRDVAIRDGQLPAELRDMLSTSGPTGGFLIPTIFSDKILLVEPQDAIFRPRATVIPAGELPDAPIDFPTLDQTTGLAAGNMYGGVTMSWIAEGAPVPKVEAAFRSVELKPWDVAGHIVVSNKLLRNATALGAFLEQVLRRAIIAEEDYQFLRGNGVGKPRGIIGHGSAITVNRNTATDIKRVDVFSMYAKALFGGPQVWIGSQGTLPKLMEMTDAANQLIWQPNAREGAPGTLLGMPFLINHRSPVLGAQGDLVLADLSYYLVKDGVGIVISASEHFHFTNQKTVILAFRAVDGQPWLSTPLKQENTEQVSPFVVLN